MKNIFSKIKNNTMCLTLIENIHTMTYKEMKYKKLKM